MIIIGLNAYHADSSACLVRDGQLVAAVEEERFRRIKHWAGFPSEAIRYCLREAGVRLADVNGVAINSDPRAHLWRKGWHALTHRPNPRFILQRLRNRQRRLSIAEVFAREFPTDVFRADAHFIEHHLAHLASAFLASPFSEAATVSVDGFGDFASAAWGAGSGSNIVLEGQVFFPHSLGIFYQAMTQYLGFPHYGDEYKVMGLAPYGEPRYLSHLRKIVKLQHDGSFRLDLRYFRHDNDKVEYRWENGEPVVGRLYSAELEGMLGPARRKEDTLEQRHRDLARSVQVMYEEAFFYLLNALHKRRPLDAITLAGGCAMNSVANGKVYQRTPYRQAYIQPAAGDAGGAIGAALVAWHRAAGNTSRRGAMTHAYWGPHYSDEEISALLRVRGPDILAQACDTEHIADEATLCERTASAVAEGKVVGWFQGRMEWGPRALGNRSIVCDPRRADMKDILNSKIKRRESFRPFAPSVLRGAVGDWFETEDDVPFMMQVFQIRQEKRAIVPAVTHVDGSGRLQTVHVETNPRYYRLIQAFANRTDVPMVLNTSFNENEPVVCRPEEALECFLRTKMDVLVLENWIVTRRTQNNA